MTAFTPTDRATWPELLLVAEIAPILRRSVAAVQREWTRRTLVPTPAFTRPLRWRKADVVRFLDGRRTA